MFSFSTVLFFFFCTLALFAPLLSPTKKNKKLNSLFFMFRILIRLQCVLAL